MAGERILVVDDSAEMRRSLVHYTFRPEGYVCLEARDGLEAFDIILSDPPDMVLTDLQMPRLDGIGLLYKMRENGIHLPVVLMTFHGSEEIAIEVFRLGVKDYIIKPFNDEEILSSIEHALSEVRLRQERDKLMEELVVANRKMERNVQALKALFDVGRVLTAQPAIESFVLYIVDVASSLTPARRVSLRLLENNGRRLVERAARTGRQGAILVEQEVNDTLSWSAIRGREVLSGSPRKDPVIQRNVVQLCAPLVTGDSVIGTLNLFVSPGEDLGPPMEILSTLADYAAIGLEQARLLVEAGHL